VKNRIEAGQTGHCMSRGVYFFYGKTNENYQFGKGILHTTKQYQQLREECVLVIKCHIWL